MTGEGTSVPVWLGPEQPEVLVDAVEEAGGVRVEPAEARALILYGSDPSGRPGREVVRDVLHPGIEWVQVDSAGVDAWLAAGVIDRERPWTNASPAFADQVAEHAVALLLAGVRRFGECARATRWLDLEAQELGGSTVGLIGAGHIGARIMRRLAPFGVEILALTRSGRTVPGAARSFGPERLHELLDASDHVVSAVPSTGETRRLIGRAELDLIGSNGTFVNVGRGTLVDTDALVAALADRRLGTACLDVTDPEPLPDGHPLFSLPGALVSPHIANPPNLIAAAYARIVGDNLRRFAAGEPLLATIDPDAGY